MAAPSSSTTRTATSWSSPIGPGTGRASPWVCNLTSCGARQGAVFESTWGRSGMAETTQVGTAKGAHLVGGLKAPDAEAAMRTAGEILGRHLYAVTDGETGDRSQWIWWQIDKLTAVDGIELAGTKSQPATNQDYAEFPAL